MSRGARKKRFPVEIYFNLFQPENASFEHFDSSDTSHIALNRFCSYYDWCRSYAVFHAMDRNFEALARMMSIELWT